MVSVNKKLQAPHKKLQAPEGKLAVTD
jgi:hypothetical protein